MKLPRISVGALMGGLVVVALDCVIYRSLASRPPSFDQKLTLLLQATLPMVNLLALVLGSLVRGLPESRPGRIGFLSGAVLAIGVTMVGGMPALYVIEKLLTSNGLDRWLMASPMRELATFYGIVTGLPLLFQVSLALVGGWIGRIIGARRGHELIVGLPSKRFRLATWAALVLVVAAPALGVEGYLRQKVDPMTPRFDVGTEAVIDLNNPSGGPLMIPKGSWVRQVAGTKVRIESDREPFQIEHVGDSRRSETFVRDRRMVQVTMLEGPRAGETIPMSHCLLRPLR